MYRAPVEEIAFTRNPLPIHDVKFCLAERRSHFVLHDLDAHPTPCDLFRLFDLIDAPDIQTDRRIELQRIATRRRLGIPHKHADLLPDLV